MRIVLHELCCRESNVGQTVTFRTGVILLVLTREYMFSVCYASGRADISGKIGKMVSGKINIFNGRQLNKKEQPINNIDEL